VDISKERYRAGDISDDDYLKIKLQLLQFQNRRVAGQACPGAGASDLRQLLRIRIRLTRYRRGPARSDYVPLTLVSEDLQMKALASPPDLRAAEQGVTAANSQYAWPKPTGKRDVTAQANYTHVSQPTASPCSARYQIPIFDRNQGEIARTQYAISQADEPSPKAANGQCSPTVRGCVLGACKR